MDKIKFKISASEVNRFIYCPYQWFYKRLELKDKTQEKNLEREIKSRINLKQENKNLGQEIKSRINLKQENKKINVQKNNNRFTRGNRFHRYFLFRYKLFRAIYFIIFLVIISLLIWLKLKISSLNK